MRFIRHGTPIVSAPAWRFDFPVGRSFVDCLGEACAICVLIRRADFHRLLPWYRRGPVSSLGTGVVS